MRNLLFIVPGPAPLPGRKGNNDGMSGGFASLHHRLISRCASGAKPKSLSNDKALKRRATSIASRRGGSEASNLCKIDCLKLNKK